MTGTEHIQLYIRDVKHRTQNLALMAAKTSMTLQQTLSALRRAAIQNEMLRSKVGELERLMAFTSEYSFNLERKHLKAFY